MQELLDASLVRIHTADGRVVGAGFLVGERQVLTCAHVISQALGLADYAGDPPQGVVALDFPLIAPRTPCTAKVVQWCPALADGHGDIAGLELQEKPPTGAEIVRFASAGDVWEHPFRAFGFPAGYDDGVWATGRLLGRQATDWVMIEGVKAQGFTVAPGFSGTPVWDTQAQGVVGMVVAASRPTETKAAFVIPLDVLAAVWPLMAVPQGEPRNPYKGLHPFTQRDAADFFGREAAVEKGADLVNSLVTDQPVSSSTRVLTILGPSGAGKSSLVMAGLLPQLQQGALPGSKEWVYLDPMVPGKRPIEALASTLKSHFPDTSFKTLREDLEEEAARGLHLLAAQLAKQPGNRVVLLVDQCEELFTQTESEDERQRFIRLLLTASREPRGPLLVLLTLRADFYDRPMQYPELFRLIEVQHLSLLAIEPDDLRRVIEQPAALSNVQVTFEGDLVNRLLADVQGQVGALPLLQFTLDQLFQRRSGRQLTLSAYHELGGVKGALTKQAEEIYAALPSEEHRKLAHALFVRLIDPGASEQDPTRRRAALSEFSLVDATQTRLLQNIADAFIAARLLTANEIGGTTTIEVSHEALIREWPRLAGWLREAREDIRLQQTISKDVAEWEQRNKPGDRLYRGSQLREAQAWAKRNIPSRNEVAFLRTGAAQRTLLLVRLIVVVLLLVSLMGIAGWKVFLQPKPTLVTTLQDNVEGSLRWCINNAPSGSTITFTQGLSGTIELTAGGLTFSGDKRLTIAGPGANQLTVSGSNKNAIIHVSRGAMLNISGLSFKNSETVISAFLTNEGILTVINSVISDNKTTAGAYSFGGGIDNFREGTLTVINSTISNNSASGDRGSSGGGIENDGKLSVTNSTFSNNSASSRGGDGLGGGIYNHGTGILLVTNSTFSNNSVSGKQNGQGGGIENEGALTVTNSVISDNKTTAGVYCFGGGINDYNTSTLLVTHSTFSNNSSSCQQGGLGGGISNSGKLTVIQNTFLHNSASGGDSFGGGIWVDPISSSSMTISSSIVAANSAHNGPDISGSLISGDYNLLQNVAGVTGLNSTTDKQVALADLKIDPTLHNNGGLTQTLALLQGSQAIDVVPGNACSITITDASGHPVTITTDQRGDPRPDGSENVCDIGAYESSY